MEYGLQQYIAEFTAYMEKLLQVVEEANLGLLLVYLWPEIVALGLFVIVLVIRQRYFRLDRKEAEIVGLDFSVPSIVQPVCAYTDDDGHTVRARFMLAYPSFKTGDKVDVFVSKSEPDIVSIGEMHRAAIYLTLVAFCFAGAGAFQSYTPGTSIGAWLTASSKTIAMTEVALLIGMVAFLPLEHLKKRLGRRRVQELLETELHAYEYLSEVDGREATFRKTMMWRKWSRRGVMLLCGVMLLSATMDALMYLGMEPITARIVSTEIKDYPVIPRPFGVMAEWESPQGRLVQLQVEYETPYEARQPLKKGTFIAVDVYMFDMLASDAGERVVYGKFVCPPPLKLIEFVSYIFGILAVISLGRGIRGPKENPVSISVDDAVPAQNH